MSFVCAGMVGMVLSAGYPFKKFSQAEVHAAVSKGKDWRSSTTAVENEGALGEADAFTAADQTASQWFIKGNSAAAVSQMSYAQIADCTSHLANKIEYVASVGGLESEAAYPTPVGHCKFQESKIVAKVSNFTSIPGEEQLAAFVVKNGPAFAEFDATSWETYEGGVVDTCPGSQLDHAALVVGLGHDGSSAYWIVKNSWGKSWGESGYIRIKYGSNLCGIGEAPSSVTVGDPADYFN
eukprot:TRINITY_DN6_c0_g3_i1.p1 TRINITY_DN6_c0_g3~~TRINITY_DN6_c0_g3_i1.p1  ORF type:complete len:238 (+),score=53.83 TRINITY_DN6_c0_g3_i1:60-773(+)